MRRRVAGAPNQSGKADNSSSQKRGRNGQNSEPDATLTASDKGGTEGNSKKKPRSGLPNKDNKTSAAAEGVAFVPIGKCNDVILSADKLAATGLMEYKLIKVSAGVNAGSWYFEFIIPSDAPPNGSYRLGICNERAEVHAPVGYDQHGYAYRSKNGSRVHQSIRTRYASAYGPGDVIGCLIRFNVHPSEVAEAERLDEGASAGPADYWRQRAALAAKSSGASDEVVDAMLVNKNPPAFSSEREGREKNHPMKTRIVSEGGNRNKGNSNTTPANTKNTVYKRFRGSVVNFFKNGVDMGPAFVHLTKESWYYPVASLYGGAIVRFNPGPELACPPDPSILPPSSYKLFCEAEAQDQIAAGVPNSALTPEILSAAAAVKSCLTDPSCKTLYNFSNTAYAYSGSKIESLSASYHTHVGKSSSHRGSKRR